MNEILHISGNIYSTKKADNVLEIPELGEYFGIMLQINKFIFQRRLLSCLATIMFRGTPCQRKLKGQSSKRQSLRILQRED